MKFTCNKKNIYEVLNNVALAVAIKSPIKTLEGILLKCEQNQLTLTGYNLEFGIIKTIPVTGLEDGSIVLNAALFSNIISKMPYDTIDFFTDDRLLTIIHSGDTEFTILGLSPEDYPSIPTIESTNHFDVPLEDFKNMLHQTLFAVAQTDQKPIYMGTLFELTDHQFIAVSVDGFRLALRKQSMIMTASQPIRFIVPGKTLQDIQKLLIKWSLIDKEEQQLTIQLSHQHILFSCMGYCIMSRLIEGEFLDYQTTIPQQTTTTVIIHTKEFLESLSRVAVVINDRAKSPIVCTWKQQEVQLLCETPLGKVQDTCLMELSGEPVEIAFNHKYMMDALKASESEQVKLEMNGSLAPIIIRPLEGDEFLFLVLPVRV